MSSISLNRLIKAQFKRQQGFTLIELIVGIIVLTLSLSIVSTLIVPAEEKSADNVLQIKASELAQSLMNDITSRAFDHNSDMSGGLLRCGEAGALSCTLNLSSDPGETERKHYNDVDDFNNYSEKKNALDQNIDEGYRQFEILVKVSYAGDELQLSDNMLAKRITVTVTTPLGTAIEFSSYKANF